MKHLGNFTSRVTLLGVGAALARGIRGLTTAGRAASEVVLFLLVLLVTADVCGRYFFRRPIKGTLEISELQLLAIIFLGVAYTHTLQGHVRVELFFGRLSPRKQAAVSLLFALVAIGFLALLTIDGTRAAIYDLHMGITTDQLRIPLFPKRLLIPMGAALLLLEVLVDFFRHLHQLVKKG